MPKARNCETCSGNESPRNASSMIIMVAVATKESSSCSTPLLSGLPVDAEAAPPDAVRPFVPLLLLSNVGCPGAVPDVPSSGTFITSPRGLGSCSWAATPLSARTCVQGRDGPGDFPYLAPDLQGSRRRVADDVPAPQGVCRRPSSALEESDHEAQGARVASPREPRFKFCLARRTGYKRVISGL